MKTTFGTQYILTEDFTISDKLTITLKSGQGEFKQLAAYAKADGINVDQLVICPVGKTDNKQGYMAPRVEVNIQKHFEMFLEDRAKFTERFGI